MTHVAYYKVEKNKTSDVAASLARPDHRKSKFGLRHDIKLIELLDVTESEFWFSIELYVVTKSDFLIFDRALCRNLFRILIFYDPAELERRQGPVMVRSGRGPLKPAPAAPRARCMIFFSRKFTKSRAQPPRGPYEPFLSQSSLQY
jgi:hypothetical protein